MPTQKTKSKFHVGAILKRALQKKSKFWKLDLIALTGSNIFLSVGYAICYFD